MESHYGQKKPKQNLTICLFKESVHDLNHAINNIENLIHLETRHSNVLIVRIVSDFPFQLSVLSFYLSYASAFRTFRLPAGA